MPRNFWKLFFSNYKEIFSIILLVVVDANYLFKCAHVGMQGRTRDGVKGKAIPLHAWTGPEGSRRLKLPDS